MKKLGEKIRNIKPVAYFLGNQKRVIEWFMVSVIGGVALGNILLRSYRGIENLQFVQEINFLVAILIIVAAAVIFAIVYSINDSYARVAMFAVIFIFFCLSAIQGNGVGWEGTYKNIIGNACFLGLLCFLTVLAFLYVKEDVFTLLAKIKVSKKAMIITVSVIAGLLFIFLGIIALFRYWTYSNTTFDFGIFAQAYEYMKNTGIIKTTVERGYEMSHYGVHFSPILYLGLPLYMIIPRAETVNLIQVIMIVLPIIPIVLICKNHKLSNKIIILVTLIYAMFPATIGGSFYDFHENCFEAFLLLMLVWAIEKNKNIWIAVFMILAFLVKEDAALYVMMIGFYFFFSKRDKKRGSILVIASGLYMFLMIFVMRFFGTGITTQDYRMSNLYYDQSGGVLQLIRVFLTDPAYVIAQIIRNTETGKMDKIGYILEMLIPVVPILFTTGKKYSRYILLGVFIGINLLSSGWIYQHSIGFQYNFGSIAMIMYIVILNLSDMKVKKRNLRAMLSTLCVILCFLGIASFKAPHYVDTYVRNKDTLKVLNEACAKVPKDASVLVSGYMMPHVSRNLKCYDIGHLQSDPKKNDMPEYPDYLLIDKRTNENEQEFLKYISSGNYELIYNNDRIAQVYEKK